MPIQLNYMWPILIAEGSIVILQFLSVNILYLYCRNANTHTYIYIYTKKHILYLYIKYIPTISHMITLIHHPYPSNHHSTPTHGRPLIQSFLLHHHQPPEIVGSTMGRWDNGNSRPATLPETNSLPLKMMVSNRNLLFQVSIFRGYVSFREGISGQKRGIGWGGNLNSHENREFMQLLSCA